MINTKQAPAAVGPYSHAVLVGNQVFISGQLGLDPGIKKITSKCNRSSKTSI